MKELLRKIKIRKLSKQGYENFTITVNGEPETMIFYNPSIIYKYNKNKFNY